MKCNIYNIKKGEYFKYFTSVLSSKYSQSSFYLEQYNYNLSEVIPGLYQEYMDTEPMICDRNNDPRSINQILNSSHWEITIPHPWMSGKCFTYKYEHFFVCTSGQFEPASQSRAALHSRQLLRAEVSHWKLSVQ